MATARDAGTGDPQRRRKIGEVGAPHSVAVHRRDGAPRHRVRRDQRRREGKAQQAKGTGQDVKGSVKGALGDKI